MLAMETVPIESHSSLFPDLSQNEGFDSRRWLRDPSASLDAQPAKTSGGVRQQTNAHAPSGGPRCCESHSALCFPIPCPPQWWGSFLSGWSQAYYSCCQLQSRDVGEGTESWGGESEFSESIFSIFFSGSIFNTAVTFVSAWHQNIYVPWKRATWHWSVSLPFSLQTRHVHPFNDLVECFSLCLLKNGALIKLYPAFKWLNYRHMSYSLW